MSTFALIWVVLAIWLHARWVALAQIPYLGWGLNATAPQFSITSMTR